MAADLDIHTCVICGQLFLTTNPFQHTCPGECSLVPTWECFDCHRFFAKHVEPHTQHDAECPSTPDVPADIDTCIELGCTFEDVCDECCTVCNPPTTP